MSLSDPVVPLRVLAAVGHEAAARRLADALGVPFGPGPTERTLVLDEGGLAAAAGIEPGREPMHSPAELARRGIRVELREARPGAETLLRAVRVSVPGHAPLHVVDATGGLGGDAGALWRGGLRVTVIERDPVVAALLEDGLRRVRSDDPEGGARIALLHGDARERLRDLADDPTGRPEVVYLDPMYPRGRGGAKRRGAAWLRSWLGTGEAHGSTAEDAEEERDLLRVAREVAVRRVVVKRPLRGPELAPGVSGAIRGTTTRFDLYAPAAPS